MHQRMAGVPRPHDSGTGRTSRGSCGPTPDLDGGAV